jgi:putative transposase
MQGDEGKLYLCAIKDVYSNRIVGYSIDTRVKASLAVAAVPIAPGTTEESCVDAHAQNRERLSHVGQPFLHIKSILQNNSR